MQYNSVMSINRGLQLLQLPRNRHWPHGQLRSQTLIVSLSFCSQSVTNSLVSSYSHTTQFTQVIWHISWRQFQNYEILESPIFRRSLLGS